MSKIELLNELIRKIEQLQCKNNDERREIVSIAELYARKFFGKDNDYVRRIRNVSFVPMFFPSNGVTEEHCWNEGKKELKNIIITMKRELELDDNDVIATSIHSVKENKTQDIFIVHGHDEAMKFEVARVLEKLDYHPVILHEQPDRGRNVLTKLIEESDNCGFAIVLLSPDDYGYSKEENETCKKLRARQNVILELGYFIGKLQSNRVVALYKDASNFEIPSDFVGTLYKKYDSNGSWKLELAKELKAAGFEIDMNKLI